MPNPISPPPGTLETSAVSGAAYSVDAGVDRIAHAGEGPPVEQAVDRPAHHPAIGAKRRLLRVAVLGAGTVGREVIRALTSWPASPDPTDGAHLELAGVAVRNVERARSLGLHADLIVTDPAQLVGSPDVDVVVELIGGDEPAFGLIAGALRAGKPVVTANKHVIARHGASLEALSRRTGSALRFEASVGGGIPVLGPLAGDLAANRVNRVRGILNGTTNYILSAMGDENRDFNEVLSAAQAAGYAEADPRGDVEGTDAVNKLVILARLAFGAWLDPGAINRRPPTLRGSGRPGIGGVHLAEVRAANGFGLRIKLLAEAVAGVTPEVIFASVTPRAVSATGRLGQTGGVLNRIEIEAEPVGLVGFDGPGAGGGATSSAVLGDLMALARGEGSTWRGLAAGRLAEARPIVRPVERGRRGPAAPTARAARRRWFTLLPAVSPAALPRTLRDERIEFGDGVALLTSPLRLGDLVPALEAIVPPEHDPIIYSVDD